MEDSRLNEIEEVQEDFEDEDDEEEEEEYEEDEVEEDDDDYEQLEYEDEEDDYEEEEYQDEEDYEEEEEYEDEEELIPAQITASTVSSSIADGGTLQGAVTMLENSNSCEEKPGNQENSEGDGRKESLNRGEIDGLFCPICFQPWTSSVEHQISCLPCGHIYGFSCIKTWIQQSPKCPQCKKLCTLKDVRVLYASRLCVVDEKLQKRVQLLEAECAYLKQKSIYEDMREEMRKQMNAKAAEIEAKLRETREEMDAKQKLTDARFEAMEMMFNHKQNMRGN
ncbi:unnamed protein product [Lactuca virosa]|uniref:RING-type domain-containing protein n=1 Tax=Lactuca virosa TaxID=75947 RepID=A0AAU9PR38_9ASTR|nr:unnamed protein product [Lactuca virosa]